MKSAFIPLVFLLSVVGSFSANAQTSQEVTPVDPRSELRQVPLVEIKAEYFPREVYHLGYAENPDHSINSVFYENNEHIKRFYSFHELNKFVTLIKNTTFGIEYDLVKLHAEPGDEKGTFDISMKYMTNGIFRTMEIMKFILIHNTATNTYVLKDKNALHEVRNIFVTTRYFKKTAIGIDQIISSQ